MKYKIKDYHDIAEKVEKMSVEDLLKIVVCPNYVLERNTPNDSDVAAFIHPTAMNTAEKEIPALNEGKKRTLIASDLEYGTGKMINGSVAFPSLRAVAETCDEELAYRMGILTAHKAIKTGYHWTFSPCVDILGNRRNPIVSIRSAGEDAQTVINFGGAYMKGLQDGGLIATLKHFPGDGYSFDDQHLTTTENPLSYEDWNASFGKVYRTLIEDGAKSIMPGHISFPAYDRIDDETGLYPPATVSKRLLTDLLREELGFEGIIISDAVNMSGFCGYINLYRACAKFLEAGGDCLLFMHANDEYIREMKKNIDLGLLDIKTLKNRAYRMLCFSREYFEEADRRRTTECDEDALLRCAEQVTRQSIRVLRDRQGILPFEVDSKTRIAHFILCNDGTSDESRSKAETLSGMLGKIVGKVDTYFDPGPSRALKVAKSGDYDLIVCSVLNEMSYGLNTVKLSGRVARNMINGWMKYSTPTVFISYYDPYFGYDFESPVDTLINTYGLGEYTNSVILEKLIRVRNE